MFVQPPVVPEGVTGAKAYELRRSVGGGCRCRRVPSYAAVVHKMSISRTCHRLRMTLKYKHRSNGREESPVGGFTATLTR